MHVFIQVMLIVLLTLGSCKTVNSSNELRASDTGNSSEADELAQEFKEALRNLRLQWITPDTLGLGDDTNSSATETGDEEVKAKLTLAIVSAKMESVSAHLTFIVNELENPDSEYHIKLKEKKINIDDKQEALVVKNSKTALVYTTKTKALLKRTIAAAKFAGKDLDSCPPALLAKITEAYRILTFWDTQLQGIEATIYAREGIRSASKQVDHFLSSLGFLGVPPSNKKTNQ